MNSAFMRGWASHGVADPQDADGHTAAPERYVADGPSRFGEPRELLDHLLIDLALERDDESRQLLHPLPAPFGKFRLVPAGRARNVDLVLIAGEAHCEPFLSLSAILALPGLADNVARDVVS